MAKEGTRLMRQVVERTSTTRVTSDGRLQGFRPQAGQLERIIAQRNRNRGPLMTYGGRDLTGQGPYDL